MRTDHSIRASLELARKAAYASGLLLVAGWAALCCLPLIAVILGSVKTPTDILAHPFDLPQSFHLDNFARAWFGPPIGRPIPGYAFNSAVVVAVGVATGLTAGTCAGYAIARRPATLSKWTFYFVLLMTLPPMISWVPLFDLVSSLHMLSSPTALGVVNCAFTIPTAAILMRAYFAAFPLELVDAARVDGASELGAFTRIVVPASLGAIVIVGLIEAITLWNELALAVILLIRPDSQTLPIGLIEFKGQYGVDLGAQFAGLVLAIIPMIVLYGIVNWLHWEGGFLNLRSPRRS